MYSVITALKYKSAFFLYYILVLLFRMAPVDLHKLWLLYHCSMLGDTAPVDCFSHLRNIVKLNILYNNVFNIGSQ